MNYLRKELYDLIKSDESIFDFIQKSSLDGLWYWDLEKMEEEWMNEKFWTTLGYDPKKMPHKAAAWQDIIFAEDLQIAFENVQKHLADPNFPYDQIVRYRHKNGSTVWIRCRGLAVRDENGKPTRMLGAHTDITQAKHKEQLLIETNRVARVGAWELNLVDNSMYWSEVTKEIHEVAPDFQPDLSTGINFYKEGLSRNTITECIDVAIAKGKPFDVELQIVTAKNDEIWIRAIGKADFYNGICHRIYGVFQDIDQRKRAETKLTQSEEQFRQIFKYAVIGMAVVGPKGHLLKVNDSFCKTMGYSESELLGLKFQDLSHPDGLEESLKQLNELRIGQRELYVNERKYIHKKGHSIWVSIAVSRVVDETGKVLHYVAQYTDITEKKLATDKLKEERIFLQTLIDSLPVNVYVKDLQSRKTMVNKMELQHMGFTNASEILGKTDQELYPDHSAQLSLKEDQMVFKMGQSILNKETINTKLDGTQTWFLTSKIPLRDKNGNINSLLGISYNITKLKEAEEKMRKYSILEAKSIEMEQFAYIASHDLREPLTTIKGYLNLLTEEFSEGMPEDAQHILSFTLEGANRMDKLIHGLLDYSRLSQVKKLETVNCTQILRDVLADLSVKIISNQVIFEIQPLPTLLGYPLELSLLFQNLIGNAIKFKKQSTLPKIEISCEKVNNGWQFSIQDNGIGIEENEKERIFHIFQRLHKQDYEGTGIGLANCKKIVELHNGEIWVDSQLGKGSIFHFTILTEDR